VGIRDWQATKQLAVTPFGVTPNGAMKIHSVAGLKSMLGAGRYFVRLRPVTAIGSCSARREKNSLTAGYAPLFALLAENAVASAYPAPPMRFQDTGRHIGTEQQSCRAEHGLAPYSAVVETSR